MSLTRTTTGIFRVPRPQRRCVDPLRKGFKGLAAGRADVGRPREPLPTPQILQAFRVLAAFPDSSHRICIPLSPSRGFCSTCCSCTSRLDSAHRPLAAHPPTVPRHLVAHAGTHTAWLIPVQSNLLQTTSFGMEDATNPREGIPEVNDTQIDSRAPNGRNIQRHHLKQFDYHPNGSKSFVWKRVGLQQVLQRLQTTEARAWITINGNISI